MNQPIPLIGQSYQSRSVNFNAQRSINFYIESTGEQAALIGTPGLKIAPDFPEIEGLSLLAPIRGMIEYKGVGYIVKGQAVFSFDGADYEHIGTIETLDGPVSMAVSTVELCIVDGEKGYILTLSDNTFEEITSEEFAPSDQVVFADGYFVFHEVDSQRYFSSKLYDGKTFDGLDFASAESSPDDGVGMIFDHGELWLFGTQSGEIWYNDGGEGFPFSRSSRIERGCAARNSIAKADNSIFWLGDDGVVYRADGYSPARISHHGIEYAIGQLRSEWDKAQSFTYFDEGHVFYVLNFPSQTFVFDVATNAWHERTSRVKKDFEKAWKAKHYFYLNGIHYVGGDTLYKMSLDYYDEAGEPIQRIRNSQKMTINRQRLFQSVLEIDVEGGVGLDGDQQGSNPKMEVCWSDDGGHTFSNWRQLSAGKLGQYQKRLKLTRLGSSRERIFRIRVTDPIKWVVLGAYAQFEVGQA